MKTILGSYSLIVCLEILLISFPSTTTANNRDGFNFYKDFLRGKVDEEDILHPDSTLAKVLYFYRTPAQLYAVGGSAASSAEAELGKRTGNAYKHYMLNKELHMDEAAPVLQKRSSKTLLSWYLAGNQKSHQKNLM